MKIALVGILFASYALGHAQAGTPAASCGPNETQFETRLSKPQPASVQSASAQPASTQPAPQSAPEAGKSLVYVVEVFDKAVGELGHPTLRVGVDGKWIGADKGNSYLSFSVEPGEHHVCTNWQSSWKRLSKQAAFTSFTADPGKTYYFRAHITELRGYGGGSNFSLELEPLNGDEGQYLVASSAQSISSAK
jgi:hypothetical protein